MTMALTFPGAVESGHLSLDDPADFKRAMKARRSGRVTVKIEDERTRRSLDQNAYWWAVPVRLLADHCGYSDAEMHYALLGECFGYRIGPTGKPIPNKPSSSELTVDEFTRLIDWVLAWGPTEMDVEIPTPERAGY